MSKGGAPRFTLENLPVRYRQQVADKIYGKPVRRPTEDGHDSLKAKRPKAKRAGRPIRMSCGEGGMNQTEAKFNRDVLLGKGRYEAVTFRLGGGNYTPDFMFVDPDDGEVSFFEVKGSYKLPTHGRSVFAFKQACRDYPMFTFVFAELQKDGRTWSVSAFRNGEEVCSVVGTAEELHAMES